MKTLIKIIAAGMLLVAVNCTKKDSGTTQPPLVINKANCGSCHALPPADKGHYNHVGMGYKCFYCHQGDTMDSLANKFAVNTTTHRNGDTDVVFTAPWNDSGHATYVKASKQCNNVYCHGAIPQGTYASNLWTDSGTIQGNCKSCHDLDKTATAIYNGHYGHSYLGKKVGGVQVLGANVNFCFNCHGANISDTTYMVGRPYPSTLDHINGIFNPGSCRDCHAAPNTPPPNWTDWAGYVSTHTGAKPY